MTESAQSDASLIISVHASPTQVNIHHSAVQFTLAALQLGVTVSAVFFYQDAVLLANSASQWPSDEPHPAALWLKVQQQQVPLLLCVTAAEKRGIDVSETGAQRAPQFTVAGLAEFAMLAANVDKVIQFK